MLSCSCFPFKSVRFINSVKFQTLIKQQPTPRNMFSSFKKDKSSNDYSYQKLKNQPLTEDEKWLCKHEHSNCMNCNQYVYNPIKEKAEEKEKKQEDLIKFD